MDVKDIIKKAVSIEPNSSVKKAASLMSKKNIGCLIVMNNKKIVGIITERDILKKVEAVAKNVNSVFVKDIMIKKVITISPDDNLDDAALVMSKHKIKKLPVVDKGELIGIITNTDIIKNSERVNESYFFN